MIHLRRNEMFSSGQTHTGWFLILYLMSLGLAVLVRAEPPMVETYGQGRIHDPSFRALTPMALSEERSSQNLDLETLRWEGAAHAPSSSANLVTPLPSSHLESEDLQQAEQQFRAAKILLKSKPAFRKPQDRACIYALLKQATLSGHFRAQSRLIDFLESEAQEARPLEEAYADPGIEQALRESMPSAAPSRPRALYNHARFLLLRRPQYPAPPDLERAAQYGVAAAQTYLGTTLLARETTPQQILEGVQWLHRAAVRQWPPALDHLTLVYAQGSGVTRNLSTAWRYALQAAQLGQRMGRYFIGAYHQTGIIWEYLTLRDPLLGARSPYPEQSFPPQCSLTLATQFLHEAAEQDHPAAQAFLAHCAFSGTPSIPAAPEQAFIWAQRSAARQDCNGMFLLGACFMEGVGTSLDIQKGLHWYRRATAAGSLAASSRLGLCYLRGVGLPKDLDQALIYLHRGARGDSLEAQRTLAEIYALGFESIAPDWVQARNHYRKAALRGTAEDQYRCARYYRSTYSYREYCYWLKRSATNAHPAAQRDLGNDLLRANSRTGQFDQHKSAEGVRWLERAAYGGDPQALQFMSEQLSRGVLTSPDFMRSLYWAQVAADDPATVWPRRILEQFERKVVDGILLIGDIRQLDPLTREAAFLNLAGFLRDRYPMQRKDPRTQPSPKNLTSNDVPRLVVESDEKSSSTAKSDDSICPVCFESYGEASRAYALSCHIVRLSRGVNATPHIFCSECIQGLIANHWARTCPVCREGHCAQNLIEIRRAAESADSHPSEI